MKSLNCLLLIVLLGVSLFSEKAVVLQKEGKVLFLKNKTIDWIPLNKGDFLNKGDTVRTYNTGSLILVFSNDSKVDIFRNSTLLITEKKSYRNNIIKGLWSTLQKKFSDTQKTSASVGGAGVLRGGKREQKLLDLKLNDKEAKEIELKIKDIDSKNFEKNTSSELRAVIYEEYWQYARAEKEYLILIKQKPMDLILYDMLIDLYYKTEFYSKANKIINEKKNISGD